MSSANLALRFLLELSALAAFSMWAWSAAEGMWRIVLAATVALTLAVIWGTFAVPDDPSRSGMAPVPVSGAVRLMLELLILAGSGIAFMMVGHPFIGAVQVALVVLHYALSADRIGWLLQQ